MSSKRSARLPPTPNSAASNKKRLANYPAYGEQNSINVLQCGGTGGNDGNRGGMTAAMMLPYGELATETAAISGATLDSGMGRSGGGVIPAYGIQQPVAAAVGEGMVGDENAEMSMATSQVLEHLSENERKMIIEVLNRDENVRQRDATRIMLLRAELYSLRRRGTLKIGNTFNGGPQGATQQLLETNQNLPSTHPLLHESNRHCARCNTELGRITNRGAPCRVCKLRVCKTCREFTTRTTDWVCVVCHKQIEIQASNTGEWAKEAAPQATQDNQRTSIRRSWTISNPEDDSNNPNAQPPVGDNLYPQQQHLVEAQSAGSYPSLLRHQTPRSRPINYHTGSAIAISAIGIGSSGSAHQMTDYHVNPQRRVLRQSTLPNSLSKNDSNLTGSGVNLANYNCVNLTAPTSPHQMQKTPLYPTAYNSEDMIQMSSSTDSDAYRMQSQPQLNLHQPVADNVPVVGAPTHSRLQVRRQSTLPANPGQAFMYNSTSPNRMYSRSPERSPGEQRYPPFIRQTSFPCNMQEPMSQHHLNVASSMASSYASPHRGKLLPQQPQQASHVFDNQPAGGLDDTEYGQSVMKPRMMRQATLPNPEQHVKLLPTSPPKRQTSPQYRRSPEFMRQQTLPNPEAFTGNSLTVHQPGIAQAKFMPISPRQKQNFLFPSNPRPFLSQQNVPGVGIAEAATDEQYSSSQSVNIHRDHAKMMKVRSHSNEEYSITKPLPSEGRRLLPEIPTNRSCSRSPSRLVRQDCLKEERGSAGGIHEMHGRTFGEAKQQFHQFQDVTEEEDQRPEHADFFGDPSNSFLEADEMQYEKTYNSNYCSEPRIIYNDGSDSGSYNPNTPRPMVHSAENVLGHEPAYLYNIGGTGQGLSDYQGGVGIPGVAGATGRAVEMHNRLRRRLSKEMAKQELNEKAAPNLLVGNLATREDVQPVGASAEGAHDRRKPEQMRSISEDGAKPNTAKPVTRRSLSHPEHDSKTQRKTEPTKIPSPKPLADILDKTRQSKIPAPIRRHSRGSIGADTPEGGTLKSYLNERRNSDQALRESRKQDENRQDQPKKDPEKENNETKVENQHEQKAEAKPAEPKDGVTEADGNAAKNHTTTLGEQEIQNAVEAAAVIFKKVVLQRRQEKKAAEEDSPNDMETSSELDIKSLTINHQFYQVDADEFKLVFLNSDSGSWRDDDSSSNASSSPNCNSITIDDCDWDYFEPSMLSSTTTTVTTNHHHILYSPMASPRGRRRCLSRDFKSSDSTASPMDSPLLYRKQLLFCPRIRESDTGTDDDTLMQGESSSQTSSDSYLTKPGHPMNLKARIKTKFLSRSEGRGAAHQRHGATARSDEPCKALGGGGVAVAACSCRSAEGGYKAGGQPPHYVPIPVPVPYPVPMAAFPNWQPHQMLPASEEGALCASIQKLWGTNLAESATGVSSNLHAAAAAAVVAAYSNAASLDAMQHLAAAQADKPTPDAAKPALGVGSPPFASAAAETLGAAAMNQSLCSSTSGYETAATGGSLEMLSSAVAPTRGELAAVVPRQARALARHDHRTGTAVLGEVVSARARESATRTHLSSDGGSNKISTTPAVAGDSHHQRRRQLRQLANSDDDDVADGAAEAVSVHLSAPSLAVSSASRESVATQRSVSLSRFCAESDDGHHHQPHTYRRRETSGNETTPTSRTPTNATNSQLAHELSSKLAADNDKVHGDSCRTSSPPSLPSPPEERSGVRVQARNLSGDRSAAQRQSPVSQQPLSGVAAAATTTRTTTTEANICNSTTGLTKVDTQLAKQPPQPQPRKTPQTSSSSEKRRSIERAETQVAGTAIKRLSNTVNESSESVQVQHNKEEVAEAKGGKEEEATTAASGTTKQSRCDSPARRLGPHSDCRCTCTSAIACPVGAAEPIESIDDDIDSKVSPDTTASAASVCSELARRKDVVPQQRTAFEMCSMITIGKLESQSSDGYLQSENVFLSSECSASDEEEAPLEEAVGSGENQQANCPLKASNSKFARRRHTPVQRTYEFAAVARRDDLISTANDSSPSGGDASAGATSSSVSSSDSVDSDDTGTIADHKPKRRHFSKVFVVNRARHHRRPQGGSSTENDSLSSSDANLEDSSDNDTDTERTDCGIVLHYVKPIGEEEEDDRPDGDADRRPAAFNFDKDAESESASNKESECDDDDDEDGRQTAAEELANCIIVVGGRTDDTQDAVVLNSVRMLGDDDELPPAAHASASTDRRKNSPGPAAPTKESEQSSAWQIVDATALACEQLHTIANDVNRLLTLTKQNSGLELKLQKLRRGVEEINQDHLAGTWRASASGGESRPMASNATDGPDMQWAVGSPPRHHRHPAEMGAGIAQMADECASSGEPLAKQLHCKYHKQPHEEISTVDLLASERTSAHEQHTTNSSTIECDGGEARDIGAGCAGGGGGGVGVGLASEQVFGGDKADDDDSENSSHSNGEARTPIYTDVPNDDEGGNGGVDSVRVGNASHARDDDDAAASGDVAWENLKYTGSRNGNNNGSSTSSSNHQRNKSNNENLRTITAYRPVECEEQQQRQHRKQVNTMRDGDAYNLATTATSGHEQRTTSHNNNNNSNKASGEGKADNWANEVKHHLREESQLSERQHKTHRREERANEACKTNELAADDAQYFMDLGQQQQHEHEQTQSELGELAACEQYRKTPESDAKQVASSGNGNRNTGHNNNTTNNNDTLKSVRVAGNNNDNNTNSSGGSSNKENSFACDQAVRATTTPSLMLAAEEVHGGLAKTARAVKNEMLNTIDDGSQVSDVFAVDQSIGAEGGGGAVNDVNGNEKKSAAAVASKDIHEAAGNIVLREQASDAGEWSNNNNSDSDNTNSSSTSKSLVAVAEESVRSGNTFDEESVRGFVCKITTNTKNNNYQSSKNNHSDDGDEATEFAEENDDEEEIDTVNNQRHLDISEIADSDSGARVLDAYYSPYYGDIAARGTHPKTMSSPNSLSAKYRSLTMITANASAATATSTATTTTATARSSSPPSAQLTCLPTNSSTVNTSRVAESNSDVVSESSSRHHQNPSDLNAGEAKLRINVNDRLGESTNIGQAGDSCDKLSSSSTVSLRTVTPATSQLADGHGQLDQSVERLRDPSRDGNEAGGEVMADYGAGTVASGKSTLPVVCLEDGLADDDSWVEEISQNEEDIEDITTPTASDSEEVSVDGDDCNLVNSMFVDREEELRGYHRSAIDFTLHTIVEESCEESEVASMRCTEDEDMDEAECRRLRTLNHHNRLSASDLEKYFFFGLGDGKVMSSIDTRDDDTASEVSSECSEGLDSLGMAEEMSREQTDSAAELASSRLEKYFLSGFMGFSGNEKDECDESGSVGSDSEGHPSPSQRRKRLVRARGTPRSHNSSLDNLLVDTQAAGNDTFDATTVMGSSACELDDSSESDAGDDTIIAHGDKVGDSAASDTMKRKKQVRKRHDSLDDKKLPDSNDECSKMAAGSECRTPTPGSIGSQAQAKKQQHHSRDSGFVGSNDDLLKAPECETSAGHTVAQPKSPAILEQIAEFSESPSTSKRKPVAVAVPGVRANLPASGLQADGLSKKPPLPPTSSSSLVRKDSFNNWSSDEETNLMMSKMRQFFKTLVVATANAQQNYSSSTSNSKGATPNQTTPISVRRTKSRTPQLAYFENELTRLMKTVPGINDEQVRELVEYLSSEDTWSDSYDSSDYNSSDLEGSNRKKSELKEQISASCQRIINKFEVDEEGDRGDGGLLDETHALNLDTALVYQKLVASFSKMPAAGNPSPAEASATDGVAESAAASAMEARPSEEDSASTSSHRSTERSPQLFAKVMQHIGTRLVALMHEVNSGNDSHGTNSPQPAHRQNHKRLQAKISITTTEDEEESPAEASNSKGNRLHPAYPQQPQHTHTQAQQTAKNKQLDDAKKLARSKSHDLLLDVPASPPSGVAGTVGGTANAGQPHHHQSSSGVSDTAGEECGVASDYERFSWRGSFESALLANGDSRTKLSQLDRDNLSSASALAIAKRRSAGDLLFNHKSLSREQLDRVRSCGSIGGGDERHHELEASPAKPWVSSADSRDARRSSVPDAIYESDCSSEENAFGARSTLPRVLAGVTQVASTNSLPRLSSSSLGNTSTPNQMTKSQGALNFGPSIGGGGGGASAKSARYRSPGQSGRPSATKSANASFPVSQNLLYTRRDARKRLNMSVEEAKAAAEELNRSPIIGERGDAAATSPQHSRGSTSSDAWPAQSDEDIDRLVAMHQNRASFSSLGLRSDSMASVYSGAGEGRYGTVVVKGQVEFEMQYNYKLSCLEIHVVRCKDLAAVDVKRNRSDPYVKVYLLPDKSKSGKRKTKVKKHTLNPIFDEVLRFQTPISSLESRTLWLSVWHSDMFGRNDFLGEVSVSLQGKVFDNPQSQWYTLQERSEPFDEIASYRGDIVVGLKFIPPESVKAGFSRGTATTGSGSNLRKFGSIKSVTTKSERSTKGGQLHVLVKEAKHLSPIKANGTCDAFCKSYLLPDRTRSSKQKTPVVKRSLHPSWNYTFVYEDVSLEDLSERSLELTVWDHDRLASNEFIGGVRFSLGTGKSYGRLVDWMDASGKELSLWQNMLNRPNFWVEGSLVLKSTLDGARAVQ